MEQDLNAAGQNAPGTIERASLRRFFRQLNRLFMVPAFRLGLGPLLGSPITGYIMVLKTVGAKTGKTRYTPLNYAIADGSIYCISGWGQVSHWYRNLRAHPRVELLLPSGGVAGMAEEVTDPDEALRATRLVLQGAGFVGFAAGVNPFSASDQELRASVGDARVIRIRPHGIGPGPGDPGGWLWVVGWGAQALAVRWLLRRLRRRRS